MAIKSFKDDRLPAIFARQTPKRSPADLLAATRWKLVMLDAAQDIEDLCARQPTGLRPCKAIGPGSISSA